MRWLIKAFVLAGFACAHAAAAQSVLPCAVYDLGTLNDDEEPRLSVVPVVNTGADTVAIISVRPSCGCLRVKSRAEIILPGDTAAVEVAFSPQGMYGAFDKSVDIITSDNRHRVHIKGDVKMSDGTIAKRFPVVVDSLRLSTTEVIFAQDAAMTMPIRCISGYNGRDVAIVVTKSPAFIKAKPLLDPIAPGKMCTVLIEYTPEADIKPEHLYPIDLLVVEAATAAPICTARLHVKCRY